VKSVVKLCLTLVADVKIILIDNMLIPLQTFIKYWDLPWP